MDRAQTLLRPFSAGRIELVCLAPVAEREREIKLSVRASGAFEELARKPAIAGFQLSPVETRDQDDLYLDTKELLLLVSGVSLRYRRLSGTLTATLKEVAGKGGRGILQDRREIEEVLGEGGVPRGAVGDAVASLAGDAELLPILRLRTRRRVREVRANGSTVAELCLDEVEVYPGGMETPAPDAKPLGRFREVEVEETTPGQDTLTAIGEELLTSPDFSPSLVSKLERGLELLGIRGSFGEGTPVELSTEAASLRLPQGLTPERLERRLASRFKAAFSPETVEAKTFHDSFDWRIHEAGGTYQTVGFGARRLHVWRDADGRVRHRLRHPGDPGFAADLPAGALRDDLAAVLSPRRLLPLVTSRVRVRTVAVLDDEEKTTLRVRVERGESSQPESGELHEPAPRVVLVPVRGYERERLRVARFLGEECGLLPDSSSELAHALEPLGRTPGDYAPRFELGLDPAMPARDAARAIHLSLLESMLRNQEGTRRDLDSEFLHDFRVAIRRTRSALTQIREVYPALDVERFKEEFRWLFLETGPTRDLDVHRLHMEICKRGLAEEVRADLDPLEEFLARKRKRARDRLLGALDSERYRRLVEEWRAFLTGEPAGALFSRNAERPVREVASQRIWRICRRMVKRGRPIGDDAPAAVLHEVRIRAKKLRYLLEFFRSLYPEQEIAGLVVELKRLQDNLGDFNDYQVQRKSLERFAGEMAEEGSAPVRTQLAMGRLLAQLEARQAAERSRIAERFERFASKENRKTFALLFSRGEER